MSDHDPCLDHMLKLEAQIAELTEYVHELESMFIEYVLNNSTY